MDDPNQRVRILSEALPYIQRFHGKIIVVKYGGNAMTNAELKRGFARDVTLLKQVGMHPIVAHGGGPNISAELERRGIESHIVHGIRVTDAMTLEVVEACLTAINRELCGEIETCGGQAVGFAGAGQHAIQARKLRLAEASDTDFGHAGEACGITSELSDMARHVSQIPVVSPVGEMEDGTMLNVNADLAAAAIAVFLKTEKLILMTNTAGILDAAQKLVSSASPSEVAALIEAGTVQGGMLPKVKCAVAAVNQGVRSAHIIDGRVRHALLLELLTDEGVGTLIDRD